MTVGEFQAWLEGFEEALAGKAPNKAQWKKIKEKLQTVHGNNCNLNHYPWYNWAICSNTSQINWESSSGEIGGTIPVDSTILLSYEQGKEDASSLMS